MTKLRCAIYTRKSSEEGLEQNFNSLDAQREACAAYILSQAGEGWSAMKTLYDDGGYSGGSMERPALRQLLADIEAGKIDVIVVYKVDRLTRSLADFARIVEILDKAGVSFVSVTQAFNTTTSMGRLTLNVLLSFAQFEREVTGERIRDKFAASKAKGMWMGGNPPLGYDIRDRALHVNETEAVLVRSIFKRYLELPGVPALAKALAVEGVRSKTWTSSSGRAHGGFVYSAGALYHILSQRLYLGEITHKGLIYQGQHQAIVERALFDCVAEKLKAKAPRMPELESIGVARRLLGELFDDAGNPMTSAHGNKKGKRYFYYASTAKRNDRKIGSLHRVSAPRIEDVVTRIIEPLLSPDWRPDQNQSIRTVTSIQRVMLSKELLIFDLLPAAVSPVHVHQGEMSEAAWRFSSLHDLKNKAVHRVIIGEEHSADPSVDRALVRAVVLARDYADRLANGEESSIQKLAEREGVCPIYTGQILPLAFLAPDLVAMILDGRQPPRLSLNALLHADLPRTWAEQRALFSGFAS